MKSPKSWTTRLDPVAFARFERAREVLSREAGFALSRSETIAQLTKAFLDGRQQVRRSTATRTSSVNG